MELRAVVAEVDKIPESLQGVMVVFTLAALAVFRSKLLKTVVAVVVPATTVVVAVSETA